MFPHHDKIKPHCIKNLNGSYFVMLKQDGVGYHKVFETNEIGCSIIGAIERNRKVDPFAIARTISELYELDSTQIDFVIRDINEFLYSLDRFGLINLPDAQKRSAIGSMPDPSTTVSSAYLERRYTELSMPYKVFIELTYECNLRCKHCYRTESICRSEASDGLSYMPTNRTLKLLDEIEELGFVEVYITGGEAFLHPDIQTILQRCADKNFLTTVLTNGNALSVPSMVERLADLNLADVRISIYGDEQRHDEMTRRAGSFAKSINALLNLRSIAHIGTAVYVATNKNYSCIPQMIEMFDKHGIPYLINSVLTPTSEGALFPLDYRISLDQYRNLCHEFGTDINGSLCAAGISRFRITPFGEVEACELLRNSSLGNININSLDEIVNGERRKVFIEKLASFCKQHPCSKCAQRRFCNFCPGAFALESGSPYGIPEYRCSMTKQKITHSKR